jgi:rhodanese-related sulfurtransferase
MEQSIKRTSSREKTQMLPEQIPGEDGLVSVDVTWGEIQPISAADEVRTVGEIEVINHIKNKLPIVDVRVQGTKYGKSIPGAVNIPLNELSHQMEALDRTVQTVFFCNGPQCPQSQKAINMLLEAGYPAQKMWYYRGGMHNWITLGRPVVEEEV